MNNSTPLNRLSDIDRAKGLAILFVVFGHVVAREVPADNRWYEAAKAYVYTFHMAFFMFLSGVVFFARLKIVHSANDFADAFVRRFFRLMPAYFLFAAVVVLGKLIFQQFGHVDNPVNGFDAILNIFLYPMKSVSSFLWYVYALFLISMISLALLSLASNRIWLLFVLGCLLEFVPYVDVFAIGQITKYFLFFVSGGIAIRYWSLYSCWVDRLWLPALVMMLVLPFLNFGGGKWWILFSVLSVPAFHGLCRQEFPGSYWLVILGSMTFPIYLMNTLAIGLVKAAMFEVISWDGSNFFFFFVVLFAAGVLIPIAIKRFVFVRIPLLDRYTS